MKPRLSNLPPALSLLLLVAVCVLWVRSYRVRDIVIFGAEGGNEQIVQSLLGRVQWRTEFGFGYHGATWYQADRLVPQAIWHGGMSGYPQRVEWRLGFVCQTYSTSELDYHFGGGTFTTRHRLVVVPYWFPAALFCAGPLAFAIHRVRRRRRTAIGCCRSYGYDLRATPGGCPECGTPTGAT
jgi:hypothetical protein